MKTITKTDVWISDNWINVDAVGRIGLYDKMRKMILLDYSMKWIVGTNDAIPCAYDEIKEKVVELFKNVNS